MRWLFFVFIPSLLSASSLELDPQSWKLGYEATDDSMSLYEYTLNNETVDNWTELVTIHYSPPLQITLARYFNQCLTFLRHLSSEYPLNTRIISSSKTSLFFEWWINEGSLAQHEWCSIISAPDALFLVRYTTKKLDKVEEIRPLWEKLLSEVELFE